MGCVGRGRSPHGPLRLRSDELACGEARADGGVEQTQQPETTIGPPRDKADAAEVYVTGASGGDYWISWYDDTGDVKEVRRRPGTIVKDPEPYRIDISKAPTDGDDVLFVVATTPVVHQCSRVRERSCKYDQRRNGLLMRVGVGGP
jgi:hypothetical protein